MNKVRVISYTYVLFATMFFNNSVASDSDELYYSLYNQGYCGFLLDVPSISERVHQIINIEQTLDNVVKNRVNLYEIILKKEQDIRYKLSTDNWYRASDAFESLKHDKYVDLIYPKIEDKCSFLERIYETELLYSNIDNEKIHDLYNICGDLAYISKNKLMIMYEEDNSRAMIARFVVGFLKGIEYETKYLYSNVKDLMGYVGVSEGSFGYKINKIRNDYNYYGGSSLSSKLVINEMKQLLNDTNNVEYANKKYNDCFYKQFNFNQEVYNWKILRNFMEKELEKYIEDNKTCYYKNNGGYWCEKLVEDKLKILNLYEEREDWFGKSIFSNDNYKDSYFDYIFNSRIRGLNTIYIDSGIKPSFKDISYLWDVFKIYADKYTDAGPFGKLLGQVCGFIFVVMLLVCIPFIIYRKLKK
ncbi:MAG: hypothetical protein ACI4V7_11245 [Succinivibrionaceae bacterium]